MTREQQPKKLMIVRNDGPDADNIAAFMLMFQWASKRSDVELVIIFEPRAVDFSLRSLKPDAQEHLDSLLREHFSGAGSPLKIRLNGLLIEQAINKVEKISDEDRALVSLPNFVYFRFRLSQFAKTENLQPAPYGNQRLQRLRRGLEATCFARGQRPCNVPLRTTRNIRTSLQVHCPGG